MKGPVKYLIYGMTDGAIMLSFPHLIKYYKILLMKPFKTWSTIEVISAIPIWPFPPFFIMTLSSLIFYFIWRFNFYVAPNETMSLTNSVPRILQINFNAKHIKEKNMTPKQYKKIAIQQELIIEQACNTIKFALDLAQKCSLPSKLRPAISSDIFVGNILWYPPIEYREEHYWKIVGDILSVNDNFKAYCAEDGCRYGLEGAFVEDL